MANVRIFKTVEFSSAHRMYNDNLDEELNRKLYGKCIVDHGHNYRLVVCLEGDVDPVTGMLVNLSEVKTTIENHVINKLDHQHLGMVPELAGTVSTLEMLVVWIWNQLQNKIPNGLLKEVTLYETDRTYAAYSG